METVEQKIIKGTGSYLQFWRGKPVVEYLRGEVLPLQITSIVDPAVGSHTITGDRSCQLERSSNNNVGTFYVYFKNYDVDKGAGIRLTGSVVFDYCYDGPSTTYSSVTFNGENDKRVQQSDYTGETKSFDYIIYPSSDTGYFQIRISNGTNYARNTLVTVNLNLTAL